MYAESLKPFAFFMILLAVITYGSLGSGDTTEQFKLFRFDHSDKLIHGVMYFLLTLSLAYGMVKKTGAFRNWKVYLVVAGSPVLYGLIMEILQNLITTDRQADPMDFLANITGTGLAFLLSFLYYSVKGHSSLPHS